jgi:phosphate transport system protein
VAKVLQHEIEKLKRMILSLSAVVEENVQKAVQSIEDRDADLAREVIDSDQEIDQFEVDVEEECLKILALHQPVAIDLRYIVAVLKINNDLERIGDLAVNIAERTLYLCEKPVSYPLFALGTMAQETLAMLRKSLDALMRLDAGRAREVRVSDDKVDAMNRKMFEQVIESIRKSPERADCLLSCLSASRSLERIADHATNMAEDVLYMIEGEIVRHKPDMPPTPGARESETHPESEHVND